MATTEPPYRRRSRVVRLNSEALVVEAVVLLAGEEEGLAILPLEGGIDVAGQAFPGGDRLRVVVGDGDFGLTVIAPILGSLDEVGFAVA